MRTLKGNFHWRRYRLEETYGPPLPGKLEIGGWGEDRYEIGRALPLFEQDQVLERVVL